MHEKNFFVHESSFLDKSSKIGKGTKIWHFSHIMQNSVIGKDCNIGQNVVISPSVILGDNIKIQNNVSVYTGVVCENDVFIGPSCVFTNILNPRSSVNRRDSFIKTYVERGASLGANSTIVCGNRIGKFSLIGAGAVVIKDVKPYSIVVGNPARQIGWISEYGIKLNFNNKGIAECKESESKYLLENNLVKKL